MTSGIAVDVWEIELQRDWPRVVATLDRVDERAARRPRCPFAGEERTVLSAVIARGAGMAAELAPLAPLAVTGVDAVAAHAAGGRGALSDLVVIDVAGALAAAGLALPPATWRAIAATLPAIATSRDLPRAHWKRALVALALEVPEVVRAVIGDPPPFAPGATFEHNLHGFVGHLAGAVARAAPLDACLPAWDDLLSRSANLHAGGSLDDATLVWAAWVLFHRLDGEPVAAVGERLRASVARLVRAGNAG